MGNSFCLILVKGIIQGRRVPITGKTAVADLVKMIVNGYHLVAMYTEQRKL